MHAMANDHLDEVRRRAAKHEERTAQRAQVEHDETIQAGDAVDAWEHDPRRYVLGISNIDRSMQPRRAGDFIVIAGLPGGGKTSLLEQSAVANAEAGHRVLIASLEMPIADLQNKMIGRDLSVDLRGFENHRRAKSDDYLAAVERLRSLPLRFWRPKNADQGTAKNIFAVAERMNADMVMIDYAAKLGGWSPGDTAKKIVMGMGNYIKDTGLCVFLLAQLQADMLKQRRRPTMADIEDTKGLNQESTGMVLLYHPFKDNPTKNTIAEIGVMKNRKGGPTFWGHAFWHGPTQSFGGMDRDEEDAAECTCRKKKPAAPATKGKRSFLNTPTLAPAATPMFASNDDDEPAHDAHELDFGSDSAF